MNDHEEFRISEGRSSPTAAARGDAHPPVPRIRFKEFGGAWESRPLGKSFDERNERSGIGRLLSVTIGEGVIPASENGKRDNSSADKSNYKCVKTGDLAYNSMRMWQGACGASAFDGIVSPAYTVLIPKEGTDSPFAERLFKRTKILKIFQAYSQGLTSDTWNLKYPALSEIELAFPSLPEQRRIAELFRNLDETIAATDARLEKLRQSKKSLLEKMFPRPGASVPEIRFKGFEGKWKVKLFGEILQTTPHNQFLAKRLSPFGLIDVIQQGDNPLAGYSEPENHSPFSNVDDVVLFGDHTMSLFKPRRPFYLASDGLKILSVEKMPGDFLYTMLAAYRPKSEGYKRHFSVLIDCGCAYPKEATEQQRIGAFFCEFDKLIESVQKKAAKLRQVKSALLEEMFV